VLCPNSTDFVWSGQPGPVRVRVVEFDTKQTYATTSYTSGWMNYANESSRAAQLRSLWRRCFDATKAAAWTANDVSRLISVLNKSYYDDLFLKTNHVGLRQTGQLLTAISPRVT